MLTACATLFLAAQVAGSSLQLHPDRLRLGVDSFTVYAIRHGDTARIGWALDELRSNGRVLTRIYTQVDTIFGTWVDTVASDARDLRPIWHSIHSSLITGRIEYSKSTVTGWRRTSRSDSSAIQFRLTTPLDDPAMFDVIARASELENNALLEGSGFELVNKTVIPFKGRIRESTKLDGQECWVVAGANGGLIVVFWISKKTRSLRRSLMRMAPDFTMMLVAEQP